jgi:hypothetical protein
MSERAEARYPATPKRGAAERPGSPEPERASGATFVASLLVAATVAAPTPARAQQAPAELTVALYAPAAAFPDSSARLSYVQGLAKAIQQRTNVPTVGKAFVRAADLYAAKPDFAIIDGQCLAERIPGALLATAAVAGETSQPWALFSRGENLAGLKKKKLAFVRTGCRDSDFLDNAMLASEIKSAAFFAAVVDKPDAAGAVAAVRDYKAADAVFAPTAQARGLTKVYDGGSVPNPGFVALNKALPAPVVEAVKQAVLGYGGGGGIDGWRPAQVGPYTSLAGRMGARVKRAVFAPAEVVRLDDQDVVVMPPSRFEQATVKQHFWEPRPVEP